MNVNLAFIVVWFYSFIVMVVVRIKSLLEMKSGKWC